MNTQQDLKQKADTLLALREDLYEMHFHQSDREWIIDAMLDFAAMNHMYFGETKIIHKGILTKTINGWAVTHDIIDPYSQVTNPIKLHPEDVTEISNYIMYNSQVNFEVVLIEKEHHAKIIS